ncbi:MAG: hypothetical protein ACI4RT_05425 [Candidatus Spyradenecus sp.]
MNQVMMHNESSPVAARALSAVSCQLSANLAPTEQEVALLTTQYHKALDGLYEAYRFGQMLLAVKRRLEGAAPGVLTRENARPQEHGGAVASPGWNAGTGLKAWLAEHCPEVNYKTAYRFLQVAEKTHAALGSGDSPVDCSLSTVDSAAEPSEAAVRAYLAGKSQRQVLRAPKEKAVRHVMGPEERAEKLAEVCKGFLESLEGVERTGESDLLRLDDRREIVTRLKALARRLEEAGR